MDSIEAIEVIKKAMAVVQSCKTRAQLDVAGKYIMQGIKNSSKMTIEQEKEWAKVSAAWMKKCIYLLEIQP